MAATVFEQHPRKLSSLIESIDDGTLALPELQRPFVWNATKVRDLLDSMFRGYPVGYLLFWRNLISTKTKGIGGQDKPLIPDRLIVDGQQRLTSLYAVIKAAVVRDDSYRSYRIRIAFRPRDQQFAVANAATQRDPEFIPDISVLWSPEGGSFKVIKQFVTALRASRGHETLSDEEEEALTESINRLHGLRDYEFSALELAASLSEEQVAEIFVRINSEGVRLNQADFILTLMSVFWDEGRRLLEEFALKSAQPTENISPYNEFIKPSPDQLLRVGVALGFERATLSAVYSLLRGRDIETKQISEDRREQQFAVLKQSQAYALDLTNWHEFLKSIRQAGYRNGTMISSETNVVYSYALYLIGKRRFNVDSKSLRDIISRWFFMTAMTGRYTGSSETAFERDLARLRSASSADEFVTVLDNIIVLTLTPDFWNLTLPNLLATSSSRNPYLFAYEASLNLLDAHALFSQLRTAELFDSVAKAKRAHLERHHLFPKDYLRSIGITTRSDVDQIANLALVEWTDNGAVGGDNPADYWPRCTTGLSESRRQETLREHALPDGWEGMPYAMFLENRRNLMAQIIRRAYEKLTKSEAEREAPHEPTIPELIALGENARLEFKSTARFNMHTHERDARLENKIVATLAGFMNSEGGTLVIGIDDSGNPVGLQNDYGLLKRPDRDGFESWLSDLIEVNLGKAALGYIKVRIDVLDDFEVCRVDVRPAVQPVFQQDDKSDLFVRFGNSTRTVFGDELYKYLVARWGEQNRLPAPAPLQAAEADISFLTDS